MSDEQQQQIEDKLRNPTPGKIGNRVDKQGQFKVARRSSTGSYYVDWTDAEALRRFLTPNGKVQGRKKTQLSAREQRMVAQAIKRARYMGLLPYTSATL